MLVASFIVEAGCIGVSARTCQARPPASGSAIAASESAPTPAWASAAFTPVGRPGGSAAQPARHTAGNRSSHFMSAAIVPA